MIKMRWVICGCCEGSGRAENPAFSNGFTSSEWSEIQSDYDMDGETNAADRYLSGAYDVPCNDCNASGKVQEADMEAMTTRERRVYIVQQAREWQRKHPYDWRNDPESMAERRMGA